MRFQIRHKRFGVYQGKILGFNIWNPMSGYDIKMDFDLETAKTTVEELCGDGLSRTDLEIFECE